MNELSIAQDLLVAATEIVSTNPDGSVTFLTVKDLFMKERLGYTESKQFRASKSRPASMGEALGAWSAPSEKPDFDVYKIPAGHEITTRPAFVYAGQQVQPFAGGHWHFGVVGKKATKREADAYLALLAERGQKAEAARAARKASAPAPQEVSVF